MRYVLGIAVASMLGLSFTAHAQDGSLPRDVDDAAAAELHILALAAKEAEDKKRAERMLNKLLSELAKEVRDDAWATRTEAKIQAAIELAEDSGHAPESVSFECRTALCSVSYTAVSCLQAEQISEPIVDTVFGGQFFAMIDHHASPCTVTLVGRTEGNLPDVAGD